MKKTNEFCVGTANGELIFFDTNPLIMKDNFKVH
jgi:hypothetical protein